MKSLYLKINFRKLSAGLLLLVFALGITPKKFLHDWLASHTDNYSLITSTEKAEKDQQLHKGGYNCKCDDLVAESNFLYSEAFVLDTWLSFSSSVNYLNTSFFSYQYFYRELRGPPHAIKCSVATAMPYYAA